MNGVKEFEDGKRYRFMKEIFEKACKDDDIPIRDRRWTNEANGKIVSVGSTKYGRIRDWAISPNWCEEVTDV